MSTRATYKFIDEYCEHTVYKHMDGYPSGALRAIANALPFAWELPRFEADDFAAAFVSGNKIRGGDIRLTKSHKSHGDTEYCYDVSCFNGRIWVVFVDDEDCVQEGFLDDLTRIF